MGRTVERGTRLVPTPVLTRTTTLALAEPAIGRENRAPSDGRFATELDRESERLDGAREDARAERAEEPDASGESAGEPATDPTQDADASRGSADPADGDADSDAERGDDEDAGADSAADSELAELEQLLLSLAATLPSKPDAAPSVTGGAATRATSAAVAAAIGSEAGANGKASAAAASALPDTEPEAIDLAALPGEAAADDVGGETFVDPLAATNRLAAGQESDAVARDLDASSTLDPGLVQELASRRLAEEARTAIAAVGATAESTATARPAATEVRTLAELPALLDEARDGVLRLRRDGARWEADIRLHPAELGAVHVRIESVGGRIQVMARCDDQEVEQQLGQLFQQWDDQLQQSGGGASFEFERRAGEESVGRDLAASRRERDAATRMVARSATRAAGTGEARHVDLLA